MATVVHRTTVEVRRSVNTPDYDPAQWVINPDLSALTAVPEKYWKISGNSVLEMTAGEKTSKDAVLAQAIIDADRVMKKAGYDDRLIRAVVEIIVDQLNTVRQSPTTTFAALTYAQAKTAIQNRIDTF